MASNRLSAEQLEQQAARQREDLTRDVVRVREDLHRELDFRHRLENQIRARPGLFYGAAAGFALLVGYSLGRLIKA